MLFKNQLYACLMIVLLGASSGIQAGPLDFGSSSFLSVRDCATVPDGTSCLGSNALANSIAGGAAVGLTDSLSETGFGSGSVIAAFDGPAELPSLKAAAISEGDGRVLSFVGAEKSYTWAGDAGTAIPLVGIFDFVLDSIGDVGGQAGNFAGQATVSSVALSILSIPTVSTQPYWLNGYACGQAGVLATARRDQIVASGAQQIQLDVTTGCDSQPLVFNPGDEFFVSMSLNLTGLKGGAADAMNTFRVDFSDLLSDSQRRYLIDNLTPDQPTPMPTPSSVWLMLTGLILLGRKKAATP